MTAGTGGPGAPRGWVGYRGGPGGKDHLSPEVRAEVERREAARAERQGRLLCEVLVRVYDHAAVPSVAFPAGSALDVDSAAADIAAAVNRARSALAHWQ